MLKILIAASLTTPLWASVEHSCTVAGDVSLSHMPQLLEVAASDRAIVEWKSFSIDHGETVRFLQPSASSVILNRVVGEDLSQILGTLQANGVVYLINPRGIVVGENGLIDTAGFLASTLDLSNQEFLEGKELSFTGDSTSSFVHLGTLRARSGDVLVFSHQIENQGEIHAPEGIVSLNAGHEILLKPQECPLLNIRPDLRSIGIDNDGSVEALNVYLQSDGISLQQKSSITLTQKEGRILLSSHGGPIHVDPNARLCGSEIVLKLAPQADDLKPVYMLGSLEGDSIAIEAPKLLNSGNLKANQIHLAISDSLIETTSASYEGNSSVYAAKYFSSAAYKGTVELTGDSITLVGAKLRGKTISVGDGNTQKILLAPSTSLCADEGGKVVVFAQGTVENFAQVSAQGGFIEISGKTRLIQRGGTDARGGTILFDPQNIIIDNVNGVYPQYQLIDPNAGSGSGFGSSVAVLSTGNIVVTKPSDNFAATAAGAVYLYDGETGALISTITGSTASDQIGTTGIVTLTGNGNYVFRSNAWDNGLATNAGAVTWGSGLTGVTGTVVAVC